MIHIYHKYRDYQALLAGARAHPSLQRDILWVLSAAMARGAVFEIPAASPEGMLRGIFTIFNCIRNVYFNYFHGLC